MQTDCYGIQGFKGRYYILVITVYFCSTSYYLTEHLRLLSSLLELPGYISSHNITSETDHVAKECVSVYKFHHLEMMDHVNE